MQKKMLINVMHPEESRVAIVSDGRLIELDVETAGREQTRGNVYKGVVVRVEPGLQAAFVDIGQKKLGFLQMGEIQPGYWQWRDDIPEEQRNRRPRIQEILRRGQELIVQVEKGERDAKGAALTTYLSLPGRYMVLMPGSDSNGVSRKVESEAERKKLKELVADIGIPEGFGYIIRTEAVGRRKTELTKDLHYLIKLYETIKERALETKAPALIYQESDLVIRTIRDYFTDDIDEVLVDSKDVYKQARAFFKDVMPKYEKCVKLHQEKRPIFSKYQLEEQIDLIYEKKDPLKSGGSIVIDPTEALVSIDVNSGKSTGEKGIEDTAFKTNMEAAEEVARQLRLRDLGGLIVIDFIDMRDRKHQTEVEKTLKNALKEDKARVSVGKISQFGLLEMSRQRIKQTINEASYLECPHCGGHGKVKSVEAMALSFLRKVHTAVARGNVAEVCGGLPLDVAYFLLNRKKRELAQIETDYSIEVTVKGKPSFMMNQIELELLKREKTEHHEHEPAHPEAAIEPAASGEDQVASAEAGEPVSEEKEQVKKKRRRRRSKKKPQPAQELSSELTAPTGPAPEPELPAETVQDFAAETAQPEASGEGVSPEETPKKKRRRGGKRAMKLVSTEETAQITTPQADSVAVVEPEPVSVTDQTATLRPAAPAVTPLEEAPPPDLEQKPKRRRSPRKKTPEKITAENKLETKEGAGEAAAPPISTDSSPVGEILDASKPAPEKPKRKRSPRKKKEPSTEQNKDQ